MYTWYPLRSEEGNSSPGTAVMNGCELPCRCWVLNLGPLQELLLTTETTLQHPEVDLLLPHTVVYMYMRIYTYMHPREHKDTHVCKHNQQVGLVRWLSRWDKPENLHLTLEQAMEGESCLQKLFPCVHVHSDTHMYAVTNMPCKNTCTIVTSLKICLKKRRTAKHKVAIYVSDYIDDRLVHGD